MAEYYCGEYSLTLVVQKTMYCLCKQYLMQINCLMQEHGVFDWLFCITYLDDICQKKNTSNTFSFTLFKDKLLSNFHAMLVSYLTERNWWKPTLFSCWKYSEK